MFTRVRFFGVKLRVWTKQYFPTKIYELTYTSYKIIFTLFVHLKYQI